MNIDNIDKIADCNIYEENYVGVDCTDVVDCNIVSNRVGEDCMEDESDNNCDDEQIMISDKLGINKITYIDKLWRKIIMISWILSQMLNIR